MEKADAIKLDLKEKVELSKKVIREAYEKYGEDIYIAWTTGKDSQSILWLAMAAVEGWKPKVLFFDHGLHFDEVYKMRDEIVEKYGLELVIARYQDLIDKYYSLGEEERKEFSRVHKVKAINRIIKEKGIKAMITGIRWDEHPARSKETYFSERPTHMRIHPILHFDEKEIWEYIKTYDVPYNPLYDQGYRSLGEKPYTKPTGDVGAERGGREADKEELMERLRKIGYF